MTNYLIEDAEINQDYRLDTHGKDSAEMIQNAVVIHVYADGTEICTYDLADAPEDVQEKALKMIKKELA